MSLRSSRSYVMVVFVLALGLFAALAAGPVYSSQPDDARARLLAVTDGNVEITESRATGTASFVRATNQRSIRVNSLSAAPIDRAAAFFADYGSLFGVVNPRAELSLVAADGADGLGLARIQYQQRFDGVPVWGARLMAHFNRAGELTAVNGRFVPGLGLSTTPTLAQADASAAAIRAVSKGTAAGLEARDAQLVIFHAGLVQDRPAAARLAYAFTVTNSRDVRKFVFVDAQTGVVLAQYEGVHNDLDRTVFDANNHPNYLFTSFCRDEGDAASGDEDCDTVYDVSGQTYNYFFNGFGRNSIDDAGLEMRAYVHFGTNFVNAFWNGQFTTYGDNLAEDDVVAHEWTHGVTEFSANLVYAYQPGALNESFSDIFGETIDQLFSNGATDPWQLGEDIEAGELAGGLRNMENPNLYNNPATTDDPIYLCTPEDNGGVHVNSGVPNKLYQLLVDGGTFNGVTVESIGLVKAGAIHYESLTQYLDIYSNFTDHGGGLASACSDLIGAMLNDPVTGTASAEEITAADCEEVANAAAAVELTGNVCEAVANENPPPLCATGQAPVFHLNDDQEVESGWTTTSINSIMTWTKVSDPDLATSGLVWYANNNANPTCSTQQNVTDAATLTSPEILVPTDTVSVTLNLEHYYGMEGLYDGGIVEYSVEGGAFQQLPRTRFIVNGYNFTLYTQSQGNSNPLGGRQAFTGFNRPGDFPEPAILQSHADLTGLVTGGQTVQLRFTAGQDSCGGLEGWYIDTVQVYTCEDEAPTSLRVAQLDGNVAGEGTGRAWLLAPALMVAVTLGLVIQRRRRG